MNKVIRHPNHLLINIKASRWILVTLLIGSFLALPVFSVIWLAFNPSESIWNHLVATVLPTYVENTLWLMFGVGVGTVLIGVSSAWLVTMFNFPGREIFEWALMIPLAMPAYVVAYVYTDFLDFAGPIQHLLRWVFGWQLTSDYWFPEVRSMPGAIILMSLVLYPYVYLLTRAAFQEQSARLVNAGRTLGGTRWRSFFGVSLPLARPAIVAGLALALLETLADFGTVDYFAINTFTRGIFNVWFGLNSVSGAAQIASALLIIVMLVLVFERAARRGRRFYQMQDAWMPFQRQQLKGYFSAVAVLICSVPVAFGFVIPGLILVGHGARNYQRLFESMFVKLAGNSLLLSLVAAALTVGLSMILAYGVRLNDNAVLKAIVRLSSMGYAVPGAVLAVGVLSPLGWIDNTIDGWMRNNLNLSTGLIFSGTVIAILFGYTVRFLAVAYGGVEAGLAKIKPNMDQAARSLGLTSTQTLWRVHMPLIRRSALAAGILVFVDVMKELPMTLVLRPFHVETLATFVYQYASDEMIEQAAPAALAIVVVGLLPMVVLGRAITLTNAGRWDS